MRKTFAILALALAALIAVPGIAAASSSYGGTAPGTVQPGTVTDGGQVTFSGCGYEPGSTITISEDGTRVGTVTAGSDGCFGTTVTVSGTGSSVLTAVAGSRTVSATVRVLAASSGAGGLPRTGSEGTAAQVWAGVGLLGLGAGFVALTVSRRRSTTDPLA